MAYTDINSEDRLVQATFAEHLEKVLGWDSVYAWNQESFGPIGTDAGTLGRASEREVLLCDLRAALERLNPALPEVAINDIRELVAKKLALFDLLGKASLSGADREKIKQQSASGLFAAPREATEAP